MSSPPINLNKVRKARKREAERKTADANAVSFGRPKADRLTDKAINQRRVQQLDAHRRETDLPKA